MIGRTCAHSSLCEPNKCSYYFHIIKKGVYSHSSSEYVKSPFLHKMEILLQLCYNALLKGAQDCTKDTGEGRTYIHVLVTLSVFLFQIV